jgi:hypothetical protein
MGGVDLLDSLYQDKIRSKKCYRRLVFHFLDMIIVTTWLLYQRDCEGTGMRKKEQMKLYTFKSYIAKVERVWSTRNVIPVPQLPVRYEEKWRKEPAAPISVPDVHLDATAH